MAGGCVVSERHVMCDVRREVSGIDGAYTVYTHNQCIRKGIHPRSSLPRGAPAYGPFGATGYRTMIPSGVFLHNMPLKNQVIDQASTSLDGEREA